MTSPPAWPLPSKRRLQGIDSVQDFYGTVYASVVVLPDVGIPEGIGQVVDNYIPVPLKAFYLTEIRQYYRGSIYPLVFPGNKQFPILGAIIDAPLGALQVRDLFSSHGVLFSSRSSLVTAKSASTSRQILLSL